MKRGTIIDSIDLADSIGRLLKDLKGKCGINIKVIYTNISGSDIVTKRSRAIIPLVERGNKVIAPSDIQRVNEQARILASNLEEEIIHQIPLAYTIDSRDNILDPLGLYSHKLEVELYLICARLSALESLSRVINQAGYKIKNLFFSGLATSTVVSGICPRANFNISKDNYEIGGRINILCDIGSDTTELLIFIDGRLQDLQILNLGGDDLTNALSDGLKIPIELAEDIKWSYGNVRDYRKISEDKEILVKKGNIYKPIKQKSVCQILTPKAESICRGIKETVDKKVDCSQVNNFVTCGRAVLLEGFLETLENTLGISVKLARITQDKIAPWMYKNNSLSGQKYLTYLTSLGIIHKVLRGDGAFAGILPKHDLPQNFILKTINRIKEVYREYF